MTDKANDTSSSGKGKPTPSRKQQEAAQKRPLVGNKTPEARKAEKAKANEARVRARAGLMAGEDKYLTSRDRGPQRRMARDIVDSQFTIGELVLPALFLVILISAIDDYTVQLITLLTMWVLFIGIGLNAFFIGRGVQKKLAAKYGEDKIEKGVRWYAAMRSIQMRPMRLPKPQVKRGTKI